MPERPDRRACTAARIHRAKRVARRFWDWKYRGGMYSHPNKSLAARDYPAGRLTPLEKPIALACLCFALACGGNAATARIVEQVVELPVHVSDAQGKSVDHGIKVTIFRE